ncbi:MAG: hypothetical protein ACRECJ_08900 [Limisphaerales bacterium]
MRYWLLLGAAIFALALFGCGANPAGNITGPKLDQTGGSSSGNGMEENIIGPPTSTELTARKPVRIILDDPRDENIIGPPIYTDFD